MEQLPKRKSNRLPDHDYGQAGVYFITICAAEKTCLFGQIVAPERENQAAEVRLSPYGEILAEQICRMSDSASAVCVERWVIMPNHVHLLLRVKEDGRADRASNAAIPQFLSALKRITNRRAAVSLWQRSYYDHVVRNEEDYLRIWAYMENNPAKWAEDRYYEPL